VIFINLKTYLKEENTTLVSLTNAYNFSGLIKLKEKKLVNNANSQAGVMLSLCLIFLPKISLGIGVFHFFTNF